MSTIVRVASTQEIMKKILNEEYSVLMMNDSFYSETKHVITYLQELDGSPFNVLREDESIFTAVNYRPALTEVTRIELRR